MAELNKTDFEARYNHVSTGLYKDNATNDISEADLRDLVEYLADSFLSSKDNRYTLFGQFTTTTSTTAYVGTTSPAITAYATGQVFQVKAHATSTGSATLNLNTLGAKKIYTNPTTQATTGSIVINTIYFMVYDSALDSATGGFLIVGGGSTVTKVGTPANNQLAVWTGDGTIEGQTALTLDGTNLQFSGSGSVSVSSIENSAVILSQSSDSDKAAGLVTAASATKASVQLQNVSNVSGWYAGIVFDPELYDNSASFYPAVGGNYVYDTKSNSAGLQGAIDFSPNYTDLSFVQKAWVTRTLTTETTQVGNVGTGEDTLFTYSLPAATLATNGHSVKLRASGTFAANGNTKTLKVKFGATTIVSTAGAFQQRWVVDCEIIRTGATTQKCNCTVVGSDTGITHSTYFTAAETLSGTIALVITGEATNTDDIVKEAAKVTFEN